MSIAENLIHIREQIWKAAERSGRSPSEISLMAVSKTFPASAIREAYLAGQRLFGESRIQEFAGKAGATNTPGAEFHMIGHLQSNKTAKAAELFSAVDSVSSLKLAAKLNNAAKELGKKLPILIEINIGGEAAKSGIRPDEAELDVLLQAATELPYLEIRGLMTVPPYSEDPQDSRPFFKRMRELRDRIASIRFSSVSMDTLSMGMSHDFMVAVEEGSTCVRIGTAIFGKR